MTLATKSAVRPAQWQSGGGFEQRAEGDRGGVTTSAFSKTEVSSWSARSRAVMASAVRRRMPSAMLLALAVMVLCLPPLQLGEDFLAASGETAGAATYRYEIIGPGYSRTDLEVIQKWIVERRLRAVPGVVEVDRWADGRDERHSVQGSLMMRRGSRNAVAVSDVDAEVAYINDTDILPPGVRIERIYGRAELTGLIARVMLRDLAFGALLVFVMRWLPVGSRRGAIIVPQSP
jgi:hypothetical protein